MSKLPKKYLGSYHIVSRRGPNHFDVSKIGDGEGPSKTSTGTAFMKPCRPSVNSDEEEVAPEADAFQSGGDVEVDWSQDSEMGRAEGLTERVGGSDR